jgi:hypothetical protein
MCFALPDHPKHELKDGASNLPLFPVMLSQYKTCMKSATTYLDVGLTTARCFHEQIPRTQNLIIVV